MSSEHTLQGRLILMTRWCTEAQGSTVLGPHRDKSTVGERQPLTPHMIPPSARHPVGLFSQVCGAAVVRRSRRVIT